MIIMVMPLLLGSKTLAQSGQPEPTAVPGIVDGRFGAIESFWAPQEAAELGVGWERILFYWNEIQPNNADDWNTLHVLEEWLVEAESQDRKVLGLLKNTPAWATDGGPFSGVPRGLYLPTDDPQNLWAAYVRRVIAYYAPRGVHNWVIWNEPEIAAGVYGHEFDGTVEDYIRLLQVAYIIAKESDPDAVIHLAGYSYWHDPEYLDTFFETLVAVPEAAESDYFFDVLSLHIYFRVETVKELVRQTDQIQNSYGIDKPIWINETNAAPNLDPWWPVERPIFPVDLDQQAWYIVQAHALGFAAGADSIGVYKLIDILLPEGGESFGILRPDYSRRPAYVAYRTTIHLLEGFTGAVDLQQTADYYIATFRKEGQVVRVLWSRKGVALEMVVPALAESGQLIDYSGKAELIAADNERYAITLDGARCRGACDIGGPPLFLVEDVASLDVLVPEVRTQPIRFLATPLPEPSMTYTPWPTHTPAPTEPPTITPTATTTATATVTATATNTATPLPTPSQTAVVSATMPPTDSATLPAQTVVEEVESSMTAEASTGGLNSFWLLGAAGVVAVALLMLLLRIRRSN